VVEREDSRRIAAAGILAPSGDNCQPWQIFFDRDSFHLVVIPERDLSLYNTNNIASFVAFGAMIENMTIAARSLGYAISTTLFPKGTAVPLVASLKCTRSEVFRDPLLSFVSERCVNRKPYKHIKLAPGARDSLMTAVSGYRYAKLHLLEESSEKKEFAGILSLNDRILFENRELHDFLFEHLRWTRKQLEESKDGMTIESLELGRFQAEMMKLLSSWSVVRIFNSFGFSKFIHLQSYELCKGSSALCLLLHEGTEFDSYVNGGRVLQRIWLTATSLGVALHPMTGITFLLYRLYNGSSGLSDGHRKLLSGIDEKMKRLLSLSETRSIIMAFRIGYADPPSDKSVRRPLEEILKEGKPPY
jgi:hypothetical protein